MGHEAAIEAWSKGRRSAEIAAEQMVSSALEIVKWRAMARKLAEEIRHFLDEGCEDDCLAGVLAEYDALIDGSVSDA